MKFATELMLMLISFLGLLTVGVTIVGCLPLVEINIVQRAIVDVGDGTKDSYTKLGDKSLTEEEDSMQILVPLK